MLDKLVKSEGMDDWSWIWEQKVRGRVLRGCDLNVRIAAGLDLFLQDNQS